MTFDLSLAATGLAPVRGGRPVARDLAFRLDPGQALVLRGANGSGKTSVLRAVAGLCDALGETVFLAEGAPLDAAEARARHLHLLGTGEGLADRLTVREHVGFWAGLHRGERDGALERVGLGALAEAPAGALSTGQRRRLGLCRLLTAPRALWLLDEPFSGLDEQGRALLSEEIARHRAAGGAALVATHEGEGLPGAPTLRLA